MPLIKGNLAPPALPAAADWHEQLALLQSGTPEERWSAARALAAQPEAVTALGDVLGQQTDAHLREAIFTSLAKLNSLASFDVALRYLRADDAQLRSGAFDAMVLMPEITGLRLESLLRDEDPDIRVLACDLARHAPAAAAAPALAGILTTEPAVNVCAAAIDALAAIGRRAELPALERCAARFPAETFLVFSIKTASDLIQSRSGV